MELFSIVLCIVVANNMIPAGDGQILAELDMVLIRKQFLNMYEPPDLGEMSEKNLLQSLKRYNYPFNAAKDDKGSKIRTARKAIRDTKRRWTNSEIPYLFAKNHFYEYDKYIMRKSMTEWERYTCIRFRPATNTDRNSIMIQGGQGCSAHVGMIGSIQLMNLNYNGCRHKKVYLHEIGHAIGLVHEHQLPDRDNFISIVLDNVDPVKQIWFQKYTSTYVNQMNVSYDYYSIMHYGITAFSFDGMSQTIRVYDKSKEHIVGQVTELSYTDVQIVNLMYNCSNHCPNQNQCGPDGHLDQNCGCVCRDGSSDCDMGKAKSDSKCVDPYDNWLCHILANQGECDRNPSLMEQHCKACGFCGNETKTHGDCRDVYDQEKCQVWKRRGECVTNERWMESNCKATCSLCGDSVSKGKVNCTNVYNKSVECEKRAKKGECSVNVKWMFTNCRSSCRMCDVVVFDIGEMDEDKMECINKHPQCEALAKQNKCKQFRGQMIVNCRKACNKCPDDTCKNLYDDVQCKIMAEKLECLTNTLWMGQHCAKACGQGLCENIKPDVETTTAMTNTSGPCKNHHPSDTECEIWAGGGQCTFNPIWMLTNCAKSCKVCSNGDTDDGRVTTPKSSTIWCGDEDPNCAMWARDGLCDSNPRYNLVVCKKSCNNCNGCRDTDMLCEIWASYGHCLIEASYMLRVCQKSCKTCHRSNNDFNQHQPENGASSHLMSAQLFMMWMALFLL